MNNNKSEINMIEEIASKCKCGYCKQVNDKLIAKSISVEDRYYATCTCGNVMMFIKDDTTKWILQETPRKHNDKTLSLVNDAIASYQAINQPAAKYTLNNEEYEETEDVEELQTNNNQEHKKYIVMNTLERTYKTYYSENLDLLAQVLEEDGIDPYYTEIYELGHQITMRTKIELY